MRHALETIRAAPGIGITAPHIGVLSRVVVLELSLKTGPVFYIHSEIVEASDAMIRHQEGSVSMTGIVDDVIATPRSVCAITTWMAMNNLKIQKGCSLSATSMKLSSLTVFSGYNDFHASSVTA